MDADHPQNGVLIPRLFTLAFGKALARFLDLVGREFRLAPHFDAVGARDLPPFMRPLDNAKALVLGHGGNHRHEPAPHGRGEVDVGAVENLNRGSGVDDFLSSTA